MRFRTYSYRFAEQVLNSKLDLRKEIEGVISSTKLVPEKFTRPYFNDVLEKKFMEKGWNVNLLFLMNLKIQLQELIS